MRFALGLIALLAIPAGCCLYHEKPDSRIYTNVEVKETLLHKIPIGTPLAEAKKLMEAEGFACELHYQSPFREINRMEKMDYLHCEKNVFGCRWALDPGQTLRIGLEIRENVVANILVWGGE